MSDLALDLPPDRLSVDPKSPFYDEAALSRGVGIRFKGKERFDVEEYCRSENWVRAPAGKARDRKGAPLLMRLTGEVEAFFKTPAPEAAAAQNQPPAQDQPQAEG
jgi:hypothetical protein